MLFLTYSTVNSAIPKTLDLLMEMGLTTVSYGDEGVFVEGGKLPLVYLTALRHALYTEKADGILYVTDVGQRDYIGMCISAAKRAGWLTEDHPRCLLSHVGFGHVQFDDFKRSQTLSTKLDDFVSLPDEAKSRCKALLVGQGQRDYIGMCISAAKRAGWLTEDHPRYLLSHVGFGHVQFDDFKRFQTLSTKVDDFVSLPDEAKSRCKALLVGQGMADEWTAEDLDHAAEALGYYALKYADLKNNRLANYTFDFDQ
nr:aminoacyl-tRNA synthetase, class 1a, anticodon-binding [Tanacetum cinerariifolium]